MKPRFITLVLLAMQGMISHPSSAVTSQIASAKLDLEKGSLSLKYFDDRVEIRPQSISTIREQRMSVDLLSPITLPIQGIAKLFSKSSVIKISPLDHTYVQIFGDPDDFGLFSLQVICSGRNPLMSRWYYQRLNVDMGHVEMRAGFQSGSAVISAMFSNELPWVEEKMNATPEDLCGGGSHLHEFLQGMRLKAHDEKDPTGIYTYKYDGKRSLKIQWNPDDWYDRIERDALILSKEIRDLLKKAQSEGKTR